jgi:hypothetical protein
MTAAMESVVYMAADIAAVAAVVVQEVDDNSRW